MSRYTLQNAAFYQELIREKPDRYGLDYNPLFTERHLQCVWFDPALRPEKLLSDTGEHITVESPGRWNTEEGPDFLDAVLLAGPEHRRITGNVEIHLRPSDWLAHKHETDVRYSGVTAHVTYYPGAIPEKALPPGAISVSLKKALTSNPFFSFDNIDVTAYPFQQKTGQTPCSVIIEKWTPEQKESLLASAGEERIRRKTERLSRVISEKGISQCFYEETMRALGFKKNRSQFQQLAARLPYQTLRELAGTRLITAYALLTGVAGLMPKDIKQGWDAQAKRWVRTLWDIWWKHQSAWQSKTMSKTDWNLSCVRPQNHPVRRLMAAALLFCSEKELWPEIAALSADDPGKWVKQTSCILKRMPGDTIFTDTRLGLTGTVKQQRISYIGAGTASAIISNVVIPCLAASGRKEFTSPAFLQSLPTETGNAIIRQTAFNLLGPDHNPALYRSGLMQQGLIQIFHDFCLNDRSGCKKCMLADKLGPYSTGSNSQRLLNQNHCSGSARTHLS